VGVFCGLFEAQKENLLSYGVCVFKGYNSTKLSYMFLRRFLR